MNLCRLDFVNHDTTREIIDMLLTIHTTHQPATDLGYLLHKHPDRFQSFELSFGQTHVFYPELGEQAITAAIPLDIAQNWSTNRCRWSRS